MALGTIAPQQIESRLIGRLRHWHYEAGYICRTYKTGSWKASLMVVNTIGHLAEAAWHHPDLEVSFGSVTVKLQTHDAKGITEMDFELADKIEQIVQWQPGVEVGALTGTPNQDPRFRYLHYDD